MKCQFVADETDAEIKRCSRCQLTIRSPHPPERCHANCRRKSWLALGDWLAWLLAAIGIRKKRGCGCGKRQDNLNRVGERIVNALGRLFGLR